MGPDRTERGAASTDALERRRASRNDHLTTSALARATGVEASTIRFYERRQLLVADTRRPSGYRLYAHDAVRRVRFIRHAQRLGLTLEEVAELLELDLVAGGLGADVRRRVERKLADLGERIKCLATIQLALEAVLSGSREHGASGITLIDALEAFESGSQR